MFLDTYTADDSGVLLGRAFGVAYPEVFTHPLREYRALTTRAALIDLTHWGVVRLRGADRVTFLNNMTTNDVARLSAGRACHSALTTVKGKLVAELYVLARADELVVLVAQGDLTTVVGQFETHIIADDVALEDLTGQTGVVAVEGPKAREVVWRLFPDSPIPLEPLSFVDVEYQGMPATILRNSVTGERGFHLIAQARHLPRLRDYLVQSGRAEDMELCGSVAWNMRRIEAGLPWWGVDVDDNFPKECRLDGVVNYEKGCFLGQETLARMHYRGHPNWLLVGLRSGQIAVPDFLDLPDDELPGAESDADAVRRHADALSLADLVDRGTEIFAGNDASAAEDKAAGRLTSISFSPRLRSALFLGYVRAALGDGATGFVFSTGDDVARATITKLPVEEST